jgi:predicted ATPase/DNA-binding winged helix-turn-helix (wHTH) protein
VAVPAPGPIYVYGQWEIDPGRCELRAGGVLVPLGGRAFDIIEFLLRSAGEVVTKDALINGVWPGAVVEENTLQVHISAVRRALGVDRGLLKTAPGRGYRLLGDWTAQAVATAATSPQVRPARSAVRLETGQPAAGQSQVGNLPATGSELIGRIASVEHVRDLLSAYRVVTLIGPGGIGKTRLALEVARLLSPGFPGGAWFAELAALSDPGLVPSAVAAALGLALSGDEISAASVASAIGARKLLLLLDNCEHVIDAAAKLAEALVHQCPDIAVLATGRESLRIEGEYAYRVPALNVPPDAEREPAAVLEHSAVRLFIARTAAAHTGFVPTAANLPLIAAICRRLDGIPLAIEFAAARAATLGLEQVLSRLDDRFALLAGGRRTALPRHQTLRATLDWSYQLLLEPERTMLRRLAVFAAGFTLEAADAIAGDAGAADTVDVIASLVGKSLVVLESSDTATRWRMLETIRAFALEKLTESGELAAVCRRHAVYFRALLTPGQQGARVLLTPERAAAYRREINNIRAALDWAFSATGDTTEGVALTAAAVPILVNMSLMIECRERVERALNSIGPDANLDTRTSLQLHQALGIVLIVTTGLLGKAIVVLAKSLELAESLDDVDAQLRALWGLWSYRYINGETGAAVTLADQFTQVAERTGDLADVLVGRRLRAVAMHYTGDQVGARQYLEEVLASYAPPADRRHQTWFNYDQRVLARAMLARVLWLQGFLDQALQQARLSVDEAQAVDHRLSVCLALAEAAGPITISTGDLAEAGTFVATLIEVATNHELLSWKNWGRCLEGKLLIRQGAFAAGTLVLRDALDTFARTGWSAEDPEYLGVLAEGYAGVGQHAESLAALDEALARSDRDGERWYVAELLRLKGELLRQASGESAVLAAETCFFSASDVARQQGALLWELRAALSLARLRIGQGRPDQARADLEPVYQRFTEGFDAVDLREAEDLLTALASTQSAE